MRGYVRSEERSCLAVDVCEIQFFRSHSHFRSLNSHSASHLYSDIFLGYPLLSSSLSPLREITIIPSPKHRENRLPRSCIVARNTPVVLFYEFELNQGERAAELSTNICCWCYERDFLLGAIWGRGCAFDLLYSSLCATLLVMHSHPHHPSLFFFSFCFKIPITFTPKNNYPSKCHRNVTSRSALTIPREFLMFAERNWIVIVINMLLVVALRVLRRYGHDYYDITDLQYFFSGFFTFSFSSLHLFDFEQECISGSRIQRSAFAFDRQLIRLLIRF